MPQLRVRLRASGLEPDFAALRTELGIPAEFPPDVVAAASGIEPVRPSYDATHLPLVTLDPPGARDLDQALSIERRGSGYRVWYAIADVAAFVPPGGPVDVEAHHRGETLYSPDRRTPLHPPALSEGAASLLPGQDRPALLWRIDIDAAGESEQVEVRRALVRSRAQLDYGQVDRDPALVPLLAEVGPLRQERERARGGVSLRLADQEVVREDGRWTLGYRAPLPVEDWNAQISLLTGMAAAAIMLEGRVGLLRTLPPPDPAAVASLARSAAALGVPWEGTYAAAIRGLDPTRPKDAALLTLAARLLRGAAYAAFDGSLPEQPRHAAIASTYAHVTAPLRRLADRFAGECCVALCGGLAVPEWTRAALPALPGEMAAADSRAHTLDRDIIDLVEAALLTDRIGEVFEAVVVEAAAHRGAVQLADPAVRATCTGSDLPLGESVRVRLDEADTVQRRVRFSVVT